MKKLLFFSIFMVVAGTVKLNPAFAPSVPADFDTGAGLPPAGLSDEEAKNPSLQKNKTVFPGLEGFSSPATGRSFKKSLRPAKKTKEKKEKKPDFVLFELLNEQQFSVEWAYGFLQDDNKYAPPLLKEKITKDFKNDTFFYLNFHRNIMQFPYILKWGIRGSAGIVRNEDQDSLYFYPLSLSLITSLQIFKQQFFTPFFEIGYSVWNVDFSDFSDFFPFYGGGALISFSLFKNSLRHTLPDEYGIQDIGIIAEWKNHISPLDPPEEESPYFLHSLHVGVYLLF